MLSQLKPSNVDVLSLTTIATPHRGSAFADYMFDTIGRTCLCVRRGSRLILPAMRVKRLYKVMNYFGLETGAFSQLTRQYMTETFNPKTPDREGIK
jgi:triacylglycerol lipase